MKNTTKKWMVVGGSLAICAVLAVLIGTKLTKAPTPDVEIPTATTAPTEVVVEPESSENTENKIQVEVPEPTAPTESEDAGAGAVSSGTEQTIQVDPVKPKPSEETLTDPTKTPAGQPVVGTPAPGNHDTYTPPADTGSSNPGGGLPGFGSVADGGANQGTNGTSDGDINTQVGLMG